MSHTYVPPSPEVLKRRREMLLAVLVVEAPLIAAGLAGFLFTGRLVFVFGFAVLALAVMGFVLARFVGAVTRDERERRAAAAADSPPGAGPADMTGRR